MLLACRQQLHASASVAAALTRADAPPPCLPHPQVRVSTWRQRIDPVLSAEEDRSAFDIHDYGGAILRPLGDASGDKPEDPVPFKQVVACSNRFEVARMFAAMLQLVNNRCGTAHAAVAGWGARQDAQLLPAQRLPPARAAAALGLQSRCWSHASSQCARLTAVCQPHQRGSRNVELCKSDVENPSQPFALQLLSTDRHHEMMGDAIAATAQHGEAVPGAAEPEGRGAKGGKGAAAPKRGGKAGAKKAAAAGSDDDSGGEASDGGGSSDEENRGRRGRGKKGSGAAAAGKKPAAKRPRKAAGRAQAVA